MADEYDPLDPPTFDAAAEEEEESYDPTGYENYDEEEEDGGEDDDYDPSSFNYDGDGSDQPAAETPAEQSHEHTPAQTQQAPKPQQKVAGFIVEESDDEQESEAPPPSQLNGSAGAQSGLGAVAVSEAQDVSLSSAPQDTAASSTSLNGSTTVHVPESTSPSVPDPSPEQPAPEQGKIISPVASAQPSVAPTPQPPTPSVVPAPQKSSVQTNGTSTQPPARLPHDKVGQLEDRIKDDPKGDTAAWFSLIDHYSDKGQYDYVRDVYDRFLKVFPTAASLWIRRLQMEKELDERDKMVLLLQDCLMQVPNVEIFKIYLDHVRRALPLLNDPNGTNRQTIMEAFELALTNVGVDPDSGLLWREYIDFVQEGPGTIGGQSWQDGQKADLLRAAYQRAIKLPHSESVKLWKEYEAFEMGLHKATGRKHIQEQSPYYVESRKAKVQLDQKLEGLDRNSLPRLPPIYGCAGEEEFGNQVEKWRGWISWERDEDPLVYKGTEDEAWRQRVVYAYRQATMSLAFYPDIWFEAASWCFAQGTEKMSEQGEQFLEKGIASNPESVLLSMMKADRVESNLDLGNTDEVLIRNGEKLDGPYETVHTALYALRTKMVEKDKRAVAQIQEYYASLPPEDEPMQAQDEDDEDSPIDKPQTREEQRKAQIDAVKAASAGQLEVLKRTISYVWVAKMRAFRRVQGQGKPQKKGEAAKKEVKGFRGIFSDARPRGFLSSDVYIASAQMEWHCYRDPSAVKIFERGMKLFPSDEAFILEYVKHLISEGDVTNARVVIESTIPKIINSTEFTQDQKRDKCRPLFVFMHDYESKYGDLAQIHKLEKRMGELYPEEPDVSRFSNRFSLPTFDAMNTQLLLSPTQALPKTDVPIIAAASQAMPSVEEPRSPKGAEILLGPNGPYVASPKRPLDDSDADTPQRKFMRAESPLKGAAGIRMAGKATTTGGGGGGFATKTFVPANLAAAPAGPAPLEPMINYLLTILPNARSYNGVSFDPSKLVSYMPTVNLAVARR